MTRKKITAVAYLRTSSPTNASKGLASDKDSDKRQRAAIEGFAKSNGYEIVDESELSHRIMARSDATG